MQVNLWNRGWVTDDVSSVPVEQANLNEENRHKWVTDLAATAYKKTESKRPEKRYEHLLKEAAPDNCMDECEAEPSRPLEMLPVVLTIDHKSCTLLNTRSGKPFHINEKLYNEYIVAFSYIDFKNPVAGEEKVYSNMRACLKAGIPYDEIPYNTEEEIKKGNFFAIRSYMPMFVWAQDKTHCRVPSVSSSGRYVVEDEYWIPEDIFDKIVSAHEAEKIIIVDPEVLNEQVAKIFKEQDMEASAEDIKTAALEMFDHMIYSHDQYAIPSYLLGDQDGLIAFLLNWSQNKVTKFFKTLGYSLEIAERAMYYFKYKTMVRAAWGIDPRSWKHYLLERSAVPEKYKNKTQAQTAQEAAAIREIFEAKYGKVV